MAAIADDWQARIGVMVPSANAVFERDAQLVLPTGVTAHFARMKLTRDDPEQISGLIDHVPRAAGELADAGVQAIGFACTTGSLDGGLGYDARISQLIETETGVPATTTSTALVEVLRLLDLKRLIVVSPYEDWLNDKLLGFLHDSGFEVVSLFGFSLPEPRDIEAVTPQQIADAVVAADKTDADGAFISCTDFRGLEAADLLATRFDKPTTSSNQATLFALLRMAGRLKRARALGPLQAFTDAPSPAPSAGGTA
jgi:maleate isomerase